MICKKTSRYALLTFMIFMMVFGVFTPVVSFAAFNKEINYQGKLVNASGVAVPNGDYNMEFKLYTVASGGTAIWTETRTATKVTVTNGLFSVMLGEVSSLNNVNFDQPLYLGVNIGGTGVASWDGEMTPRKKLGAVAAAVEAYNLGGASSTQYLRDDIAATSSVSSASTALSIQQNGAGNILDLFDGTTKIFTVLDGGNVGIGTSSPYAKLSVAGNIVGTNLTATGTLTVAGAATFASSGAFTGALSASNLSGTNTGNVTLSGQNYLSLAGQAITASQINLTSHVTGTLPVGNGGTGATTLTGVLKGNGTSAFTAMTGTANYVTRWTDANTLGIGVLLDNGTNIGIGTSSPSTKLSVEGNALINGTITSGAITSSGVVTGTNFKGNNYQTQAVTRTLPTTVNNAVDIGTFAFTNGGGQLDISIVVPSTGFSISKKYLLPIKYAQTSGWVTALPISDTNAYGGNDVALDVQVLAGSADLRIRRTAGSTAGTAYVTIKQNGVNTDTFTESTTVTAVSAPSSYLASTALTQIDGNVGIGTSSPYAKLSVAGTVVGQSFVGTASATSTLGGGLNLSTGCYAIGGTCITTGSGTVNSGTAGYLAYYPSTGTTVDDSAVFWDNTNGRLGIGTASPQDGLHVHKTSGNSIIRAETTDTAGYGVLRLKSNAGGWQFATGGSTSGSKYAGNFYFFNEDTTRTPLLIDGVTDDVGIGGNISDNIMTGAAIVLKQSGNVGIGTTTPDAPLGFAQSVGEKIRLYSLSSTAYGLGVQSNIMQLYAPTTNDRIGLGYGSSASFTETLTVKGSNVGIGYNNPQRKFVVATSDSSNADMVFQNLTTGYTAADGFYVGIDANEVASFWNYENTGMEFGTNGASRMMLTAGGNLGIGTSSPFAKLSVAGDTYIGGNLTATGTISASNLSGTNTGNVTLAGENYLSIAGQVITAADVNLTTNVTGTLPVANGGTGATTLADLITLGTHTTGNYVASVTGGTGITVSGTAGEGWAPSIAVTADSIGDTQLAFNTGQNLTTASSPTFAGLTLTADLSVANGGTGASTLTGVLKGNGTSAFTAMTGTSNMVTRWTDANTIGTGVMYDTGTNVGIGTSSPFAKLSVAGDTYIGGNLTATGTLSVTGGATVGSLSVGSLNGVLTASSGNISATSLLGVTVGGTGASTLTGVLKGNGTSAFSAMTGTTNYVTRWTDANTLGTGALTDTGTYVGVNISTTTARFAVNSGGSGNVALFQDSSWGNELIVSLQSTSNARLLSGVGDSLNFGANGTNDYVTIGTSGNVGVGTTSPYAKLSVAGTVVGQNFIATSTSATSTFAGATFATSGGNVGIGTLTPNRKFTVSGGVSLSNVIGTNSTGDMGIIGDVSSFAGFMVGNGAYQTSGISGYINTSNGSAAFDYGAISTNGSGLLTTTSLAISGSATTTAGNGINITTGCYAINGTCIGAGSGSGTVNSGTANTLSYYASAGTAVSSTGALYWDNTNGRLGIGTSSPYAKLSVAGTIVGANFIGTSTSASQFGGDIVLAHTSPLLRTNTSDGSDNKFLSLTGGGAVGTSRGANIYLEGNEYSFNPGNVILEAGNVAGAGNGAIRFWTGSSAERMIITNDGNVGIATTSPYAKLSVAGTVVGQNFIATSTTATTTFSGGLVVGNNAIKYDWSTGVTSIDNLELGAFSFDADGGIISWVDMPVTSASASSTVHSYTAQLDGNAALTVYGLSNGSGGVNSIGVGIGSTTPSTTLVVAGTTTARGIVPETNLTYDLGASNKRWDEAWISTLNLGTSTWSLTQGANGRFSIYNAASAGGTETFSILSNGRVGIGTTSPTKTLAVAGDSYFSGIINTEGTTVSAPTGGSAYISDMGLQDNSYCTLNGNIDYNYNNQSSCESATVNYCSDSNYSDEYSCLNASGYCSPDGSYTDKSSCESAYGSGSWYSYNSWNTTNGTWNFNITYYGSYPSDGATRYYRIYAYKNDDSGIPYVSSSYTTAQATDSTSGSSYNVNLSWNAVSGADGYRIIRSVNSNTTSSFDSYYDTTSTSFTDGNPFSSSIDPTGYVAKTKANALKINGTSFNINELPTSALTVGHHNIASSTASSFGYYNVAGGSYGAAFGYDNRTNGAYALALGTSNDSLATYTSAIGYSNTVNGNYSYVIGHTNTSYGTGSTYNAIFGQSNTSYGIYNTITGYGNTSYSGVNYITTVGSSNLFNSSGTYSSVFGRGNYAYGGSTIILGNSNQNFTSTASSTVMVGFSNSVSTTTVAAIGFSNSISGNGSLAVGHSNSLSAYNTYTLGRSITNSTANTVMIGPSDSSKLTVGLTGVGIGTTTPYGRLSIQTSATTNVGLVIKASASQTANLTEWRNSSGTVIASVNASGVGSFTSSRDFKENFTELDKEEILKKIEQLEITEWNYIAEATSTKHIGPIAEQFHELFGLNGDDNKHITTIDPAGVALAGIQGLSIKLNTVVDRVVDGVAYLKHVVMEGLTIGSKEKPAGITMFDEVTGEPYCLKIRNGETVTIPGECIAIETEVEVENPQPVEDNVEEVPVPDPIVGTTTATSTDTGVPVEEPVATTTLVSTEEIVETPEPEVTQETEPTEVREAAVEEGQIQEVEDIPAEETVE